MSDERILAEVVRADQIKAGDRIVWLDKVVTVKAIDRHGHRIELIYDDRACVPAMRSELVARILPSPVEVRDVWRAECHAMTKEGTEEECRSWVREMGYGGTIEEITEIVKRREELKPWA